MRRIIVGQRRGVGGDRPGPARGRASGPGPGRRTPGTGSRRRRTERRRPTRRSPRGRPCWRPYSIWRATAVRQASASSVPGRLRSSRRGIRYSNIVPPQEIRPIRPAARDERPAELEPVPPGGVAPRDGQEAGQARLGGQQVVAGVVEPALRQVAADGEQVAIGLVEEGGSPSPPAKASARPASLRPRSRQVGGGRLADRLGQLGESRGDPVWPATSRHDCSSASRSARTAADRAAIAATPVTETSSARSAGQRRANSSVGVGWAARSSSSVAERGQPGGDRGQLGAALPDLGGEAAGPGLQPLGAARDGLGQGPDPAEQADRRPVELAQPVVPAEQVGRGRPPGGGRARGGRPRARRTPGPAPWRRAASGPAARRRRPRGVSASPRRERRPDERLVDLLVQPLLQGHQAAEQVAAVDRRDVRRGQRLRVRVSYQL